MYTRSSSTLCRPEGKDLNSTLSASSTVRSLADRRLKLVKVPTFRYASLPSYRVPVFERLSGWVSMHLEAMVYVPCFHIELDQKQGCNWRELRYICTGKLEMKRLASAAFKRRHY